MTRPDNAINRIDDEIDTPALVWDMDVLDARLAALRRFSDTHACRLYYSVKASAVAVVLDHIAAGVDGFSCSSPFEARLSRQVLGNKGVISLTSPALTPAQCDAINETCDHISFNSLGQMKHLGPALKPNVAQGLRINPGLSIVDDPRYDPSRENSKLGIPINSLVKAHSARPDDFVNISGLHIHTACGNRSFKGLTQTIELIEAEIPALLHRARWFNLGGGYAFDKILKTKAFDDTVSRLRDVYGLDVILEPGTAMVQNAARMVSTVVDIFESGTATHAVLDTSVNHMPEVFAYQFQPPVKGARRDAPHTYTLAGATCLAGDIFGTYSFDQPLEVGQRLVIEKTGAYTHGQSHWFNGINLPTVYSHSGAGGLKLERAFTFEDFASRCGVHR
ncbi:MAG: hypothetical protein HOH04_00590 [Rhodospirillaceae bacterium]|nr:hypothetical protein [Rhodospirillaceae bacterium]